MFSLYSLKNPEKLSKKHRFRARRLLHIFMSMEIALALIAILELVKNTPFQFFVLFFLMLLLLPVYFKIQQGKIDLAASYLLGTITVFIMYFMWSFEGLKDESLLAFPTILIFAAIIGDSRLFWSLLSLMILNIIALGYVNETGLFVTQFKKSSIESSLIVSVIILITSYSVWLLSKDMKRILAKYVAETKQVKASQEAIEKLVHHDNLTGLPNRVLARDRFKHAVEQAKRDSSLVCMMFIDLDNFKHINDSLGHQSGDQFLIKIAEKLKHILRKSDTVCRLGGDEFLVILEQIKQRQEVLKLVEKILTSIKEPVSILGHEISNTCSIGITMIPEDGTDFDAISRKADMAMYRAKEEGKNNFCFFDEKMNQAAKSNIELLSELQKAMDGEKLELHYQPKVDLKSNRIIGVEALLRWNHPDKGYIAPNKFIHLAESSGKIIELGNWVIDEACHQCRNWLDMDIELPVAINISSLQFQRGDVAETIIKALEKNKMDGKYLEIEITESLLLDQSGQFKKLIQILRNKGVKFSIDDFGTGYSNLGYIRDYEMEVIKIDRSFICKVTENEHNKAIVTAIIQMAKSLNIKTIAEGLENAQEIELLTQLHCDIGQGFYWSKALPADELMDYYQSKMF